MTGPSIKPHCSRIYHQGRINRGDAYDFCPECGQDLREMQRENPRPENNPDYVTMLACSNPHRALVAVMSYDKPDDSYRLKKCSDPLSLRAAQSLAESWAAALHLEIR